MFRIKKNLKDYNNDEAIDQDIWNMVQMIPVKYLKIVEMYLKSSFMINAFFCQSNDNLLDLTEYTNVMEKYVSLDIIQQVWLAVANIKNGMFRVQDLGEEYCAFTMYFFSMYYYFLGQDGEIIENELMLILSKYNKSMMKQVSQIMNNIRVYNQAREASKLIREQNVQIVEPDQEQPFVEKEQEIQDINIKKEDVFLPLVVSEYDALTVLYENFQDDYEFVMIMKHVNRKCYERYCLFIYKRYPDFNRKKEDLCLNHQKKRCRSCRRRQKRKGDYLSMEARLFVFRVMRNNLFFEVYNNFLHPCSRTYIAYRYMSGVLRFFDIKMYKKRRYHMCKCSVTKAMGIMQKELCWEIVNKQIMDLGYDKKTGIPDEDKRFFGIRDVQDRMKVLSRLKGMYSITTSFPRELNMEFSQSFSNLLTFQDVINRNFSMKVVGVYCPCENIYARYIEPIDFEALYWEVFQSSFGEIPFFSDVKDSDDYNMQTVYCARDEKGEITFFFGGQEIDEYGCRAWMLDSY